MTLSRRSFLSNSAAFGFSTALLAECERSQAADETLAKTFSQPTAGELFWQSLYTSKSARGASTETPEAERDPRFVQYSDKTGLRWVEDIKTSELPSFDEDAVVTMELTGFRAGSQDNSKLSKARFAQLHLSCQRVTGSEFLGPLVWASLATVFTANVKKLPAEQNLTWNALKGQPSQPGDNQGGGPRLTHMVLNQGAGHVCVNITTTPSTSLLDKILAVTIQATKIMTPLLGFPGITLPALENFYTFYGTLEKAEPANFLLNSAQKDVAVTQQGVDNSLISANALKLISGDYILMPRAQEDDFQKEMDKLIVQDGYLVERDSKAAPDARIAEAVPGVSYVVLNVKVQPASAFPATSTVTDPMLDSPAGNSSDSGGQQKGKKGSH